MAGKMFLNYRREDSISTAGRLHDRLAQTFGRQNVFMDVDHIPAGVDFHDYLDEQVTACDVFLAVIGPNWLDAKDEDGRRRFDNPDDFVTIEIAAALARNIRVIPVLVDGARTPKADKLPESIKSLVRRNAVEVRNTHFGRDAEGLIDKIKEAALDKPIAVKRWRAAAAAVAALLLLGGIGLFATGIPFSLPGAVQPDTRAQAERDRLAAEKAEQEHRKAPAEVAEAKAKAEQVERDRLAAEKAKEERRKATAEAAEAKAKAEQVERDHLAAEKAKEERRKAAEAEAQARSSSLVNQGRTDIKNRDYDKAILGLNEAIRLDPKNARAFLIRGVAYEHKGDIDRAIADDNEAIRLDPNYAMAFNHRGFAYSKKGDNDRAVADYSEAIRLDPKNVRALLNRANVYDKKGNSDRAMADFTEAVRLDPNNASTFYSLGVMYSRKGDSGRAIAEYNEAIRLNPNYAQALGSRGLAYANKGDVGRAMADYNAAIRVDPNGANNLCNRGKLKLQISDASGHMDIERARQLDASACRTRALALEENSIELLSDQVIDY